MIKFIKFLIQVIFWLQAFLGPLIVSGFIAFIVYSKGEQYKIIAILILIAGVAGGIWLAEFIRRKYGLDTFFARIYGPNEMDDKTRARKE